MGKKAQVGWRHGANCPICHLAGPKGLRAESRALVVQLGGRSYLVLNVPGYVCPGRCDFSWYPHPDWGDGSKRSHRAYSMAWSQHRKAYFNEVTQHCEGCRAVFWTELHHKTFRSQGGGDEFENLEGLCEACHRARHT